MQQAEDTSFPQESLKPASDLVKDRPALASHQIVLRFIVPFDPHLVSQCFVTLRHVHCGGYLKDVNAQV